MPVDQATVLRIACDNPECPGNDLDPTNRLGWTFITTEVYGQQVSEQKVYCCPDCAGHVSTLLQAEEAKRNEPMPPMMDQDRVDELTVPSVDPEAGKV